MLPGHLLNQLQERLLTPKQLFKWTHAGPEIKLAEFVHLHKRIHLKILKEESQQL
jgi:hypothetical protein